MSSPSLRTKRKYAESFSVRNFCASSSETTASLATFCSHPVLGKLYQPRQVGASGADSLASRAQILCHAGVLGCASHGVFSAARPPARKKAAAARVAAGCVALTRFSLADRRLRDRRSGLP